MEHLEHSAMEDELNNMEYGELIRTFACLMLNLIPTSLAAISTKLLI